MRLIIILSLFSFASSAFARSYREYACGSRVVFNCDRHVATMGGLSSPLDCGVSTPRYKRGRIQGVRRAAGSRWRCLRGAKAVDIGLGAVIVHAPCGGRMPKGQNQHFRHSGCMNVTAQFRDAIARCRGATYEVQYASKGSYRDNSVRMARRQQAKPRAYGYNQDYGYGSRDRYEHVAELFGSEGWR